MEKCSSSYSQLLTLKIGKVLLAGAGVSMAAKQWYICLLAIFISFNCSMHENTSPSGGDTILYRTSEDGLVFQLKIDDNFYYYDSLRSRDVVLGYPIGRVKKKKDSSTIHLRINEKDTIFRFALFEADSVLFGLAPGRRFYIVTNKNEHGWVID